MIIKKRATANTVAALFIFKKFSGKFSGAISKIVKKFSGILSWAVNFSAGTFHTPTTPARSRRETRMGRAMPAWLVQSNVRSIFDRS
jgi:hypothetical protein